MAQALFDEHPLEQYLRNSGENFEPIPGTSAELESELDPGWVADDEEELECPEWRPLYLIQAMEMIAAVISALDIPHPSSPFVEHFKYDVISSTLLSVSLPSSHSRTPWSPPPDIPGHLTHSRTSSTISTHQSSSIPTLTSLPNPSYLIPSLAFLAFAIFFHAQHYFLALAFLGTTVYAFNAHETTNHDMSPSLNSLNELITSNNEWEKVVQMAIDLVDYDEQSTYGSSNPPSPSSSLRITLHSSLLSTQTQCDNVRQLFSALTLPSELSQLSEMYAPPSPMFSSFSRDGSARPLSLPSRRRTLSMPSDPFLTPNTKRQTWNGSNPRFSQLGSPTFRHRDKHRADLSAILQPSSPSLVTVSAPVTPPPTLPKVDEDTDSEYEDAQDIMHVPHTADGMLTFGAAALALHRKRKTGGLEAFRLPPASSLSPGPSPHLTPLSPRTPPSSTYYSGSRLTPIQAGRHPLSPSAINYALQSALASRRFACAHLLALRFADEEDDGYWEDVRSVMGLLTTTLADASSRLSEAITEVEQQKLRDQNPTPSSLKFTIVEEGDQSVENVFGASPPPPRTRNMSISFAPLPSHLSRFAAHVEAITSALDDARENLEQCISSLRNQDNDQHDTAPVDRHRRKRSRSVLNSSVDESAQIPPAIEAYERLRRELGLALRECERGRERLLDVVYPPDMYIEEDEGDLSDDVPPLGHDGSDESDKPDPTFPFDLEQESPPAGYAVVALEGVDGGALDDVTSHLLLSTSTQHLPPPGIEQVFEAESGNVGAYKRERSKLTREERIKLMKEKRESGGGALGLGLSASAQDMEKEIGTEKWGPGGDVVQELKDVIWKVGERRRRIAETTFFTPPVVSTPCEPGVDES